MILDKSYYEIIICGVKLYTEQKDFLNILLDTQVIDPKKFPMKMGLDISEIRVYHWDKNKRKRKLVWGTKQSLSEFEIGDREDAILDLLSQGFSYNEIAEKCHISRSTVVYHSNNIKKKFNVKTIVGAVGKYNMLKYK